MIKIVMFSFTLIIFLNAGILQESIDRSPPGSVLKLSSGVYPGNIIINKPITIIGQDKNVIIKGEGKGKIISINSSHVVLKNLQITHSGSRMTQLDAAISMHQVRHCEISHCRITDSLYGIDMNMVQDSIISNNYITSQKNSLPLRGDALKIWYGKHNLIKNNRIERVRDITLIYSDHNVIDGNTFINNRFALHLSMSHHNTIKDNTFKYNAVSILLMGIKDSNVTGNRIWSSKGVAAIGVVADKVSNFHFENNSVRYNAKALYIDEKGNEKGTQRFIKNNQFLYNGEVFHFHSAIKNNVITHNIIKGNIEDVLQDLKAKPGENNFIAYNYWDRYEGFDRDHDNIGDRPYRIFLYADQLWKYDNKLKFFYSTPIMSVINFLSQIAPFIEPVLLLEDSKPLIHE